MEIKSYSIPYDLDTVWDEGCFGTDWGRDLYGDEVTLLVSEAGSSYVCPEKIERDWRLYVSSSGRAVRLDAKPGEAQQARPWRDASSLFNDILACGREAIEGFPKSRSGEGEALPLVPEDIYLVRVSSPSVPIEIGPWHVRYGKGLDELDFTRDGFVWGQRRERAIYASDPGYEIGWGLFPYLLPPAELARVREGFAARRGDRDDISASALLYLERLIERAIPIHREIFAFEATCQDLADNTASMASEIYHAVTNPARSECRSWKKESQCTGSPRIGNHECREVNVFADSVSVGRDYSAEELVSIARSHCTTACKRKY